MDGTKLSHHINPFHWPVVKNLYIEQCFGHSRNVGFKGK